MKLECPLIKRKTVYSSENRLISEYTSRQAKGLLNRERVQMLRVHSSTVLSMEGHVFLPIIGVETLHQYPVCILEKESLFQATWKSLCVINCHF